MDKILSTRSYGICVFSLEVLQDFLKKKRVRSKKLLEKFQRDKEFYLDAQKEGIWIPFAGINSIDYVIKLEGSDVPFDDTWEQRMEYGGFNIEIRDSLWICDIGSFYAFNQIEYCGNEGTYKMPYGVTRYFSESERFYQSSDGHRLYSDFKYEVPSGKYLLSVKGYARKQALERPNSNFGFLFSLVRVDAFEGYKNPREDTYDFNVAGCSER